jgi:hypothetical protein
VASHLVTDESSALAEVEAMVSADAQAQASLQLALQAAATNNLKGLTAAQAGASADLVIMAAGAFAAP